MTKSILMNTALIGAISAFAVPVAAQDLCGGAGTGGQWIGGSQEASDIASADSYQEQMALVLGGNSHVALFSVSEQASVRVAFRQPVTTMPR